MLARQGTTFSHWNTDTAPAEAVVNLSAFLVELLESGRSDAFEYYRKLVEKEANARGIEDIWEHKTWKVRA